MFIGLVLAVVIIVGYAMYADKKFARKDEMEKLKAKIAELEEKLSG
jgi:Tfp pilus assembly protein PilO